MLSEGVLLPGGDGILRENNGRASRDLGPSSAGVILSVGDDTWRESNYLRAECEGRGRAWGALGTSSAGVVGPVGERLALLGP